MVVIKLCLHSCCLSNMFKNLFTIQWLKNDLKHAQDQDERYPANIKISFTVNLAVLTSMQYACWFQRGAINVPWNNESLKYTLLKLSKN